MKPQVNVNYAREMEQYLATHGFLAEALLEILRDERVTISSKGPAIAAARYAVEELDLIPDGVPLYGQMDDLFIKAIALDDTLPFLGAKGTVLGARKLPDGETLSARLKRMKDRFFGFWSYCKKAADPLVQSYIDHYDANPQDMADLVAGFEAEVREIRGRAGQPVQLKDRDVEQFVAQFRCVGMEDLA